MGSAPSAEPVQTPKLKRGRKPKNNTQQQQQQTKSITVKKEDPEILDETQGKDIAIIHKLQKHILNLYLQKC